MGTVLVVVSTVHRAHHVRTVLGERLRGQDVRVFSTDGPIMQAPANQMGVDVSGLTLRPLWIRTWTGTSKRLLDAAKGVDEVIVLHEPTQTGTGDAHLVVKLFDGTKTPVRCVGVLSFEAPVILNALAGTDVIQFPFNQDVYDTRIAVSRILRHGVTSAVSQVLENAFDVPHGLGFLLARGTASTDQETKWSVEGHGDGFKAHQWGDTFSTREEAMKVVQQLQAGIAVSTVDEDRTIETPRLPSHSNLLLLLTKKFNFTTSYAEEMLNRLFDQGFLGRTYARDARSLSTTQAQWGSSRLPARVSDVARMVIEDSCGPLYVGTESKTYPEGTWYATDPGVRPSMLTSHSKDIRAVYGILWALTVGSHSTPVRVRSRVVKYRRRASDEVLLMAGVDTVVDAGWRRPVAGVLDVPAGDTIGDDFTIRDIRVVEHTAKSTRGFSTTDLLGMHENVREALTYATTAGLLEREAGSYVTTPKGQWLLGLLDRLQPDFRTIAACLRDEEAAFQVASGAHYKKVVQAQLDKVAELSKTATALLVPERCPSCKKKVALKVNKQGVGTRCKACTKSFTAILTDKGLELT